MRKKIETDFFFGKSYRYIFKLLLFINLFFLNSLLISSLNPLNSDYEQGNLNSSKWLSYI